MGKQQREKQSQEPKVCAQCKVKKHGLEFSPASKKCRICCYKQQREKQSQDPKMCVECKVEKHGLKFGPSRKTCLNCDNKFYKERRIQKQENVQRISNAKCNKESSDFNFDLESFPHNSYVLISCEKDNEQFSRENRKRKRSKNANKIE